MRVVEEATRCNPIAERLKIAPLFRVRRYSKENERHLRTGVYRGFIFFRFRSLRGPSPFRDPDPSSTASSNQREQNCVAGCFCSIKVGGL
jgi:hypothetical protein